MAEAFDDELRSTMVVIAAAAFAIDALYVRVDELLEPEYRNRAERRVGRIIETLKVALDLGPRTQRWQTEIGDLFDKRDELVHFRGKEKEPLPHPTGKSNVSHESASFTAEEATRAVDLALEVLKGGYTLARPKHAALQTWNQRASHVPAWFDEVRETSKKAPSR